MRAFLRYVCLPGVFCSSMFAQFLGFGVDVGLKGGSAMTDALEPAGVTNAAGVAVTRSTDYVIGPAAEVRIPLGLAFEVDGLYRPSEYRIGGSAVGANVTAHAWEIPYLGKFRLPTPLLKPFITAGGAYRTFTSLSSGVTPSHNAFVLGGGLELKILKLRLSAEARWLHWDSASNNTVAKLSPNQGEVLFGLMF